MTLYYGDGHELGDYAVELHDRVEIAVLGRLYDGVVTAIHPKSREVTVRYQDHGDVARTTGNPRRKTARVHILAVDLIARDG